MSRPAPNQYMSKHTESQIAQLEETLNSAHPERLYHLAEELRDSRFSQLELLELFAAVHRRLPDDVDQQKYDTLQDVMDAIDGRCAPGTGLYPRPQGTGEK